MKLSVFSPVLANMSLEDALKYLSSLGVDAMELGCGGCPGTAHADVLQLAAQPKKVTELKNLFDKYNMSIAALSVHGNGVHPVASVAKKATDEFEAACKVGEMLGVERVITFSGCPGDKTSTAPNWVTCAWPNDYSDLLEWQWNEVLIPYWKKEAAVAENHGIKVCFEMHPGFCVYNASSMLRIRDAVGKTLGANLDPSHLLWQGADIVSVIKQLGAADALYYFHAKDTAVNLEETRINGVLDTKSYADEIHRSWIFRTVGYGDCDWKNIISALRLVGYDHVLSIEHEDSLMTPQEGLEKAVAYLKNLMIKNGSKAEMWWV